MADTATNTPFRFGLVAYNRIGRITKGLLLDVAREVDVIEPVARFTDALRGHPGVRTIFNVGLEDWRPRPGVAYDIIWTQWCLGHLRDGDVVQYLRACRAVLRPGSGVIVVKENISTDGEDVFDGTDSSVTRSVTNTAQRSWLELTRARAPNFYQGGQQVQELVRGSRAEIGQDGRAARTS